MRRAIARGRVFPQSYSTDRRYGRLSLKTCALFPLIWVNADDQGRLCGDPEEVKYACCPNIDHITKTDIPELLKDLERNQLIKIYDTPKSAAIQILDWWDVQRPQWAWPSQYPPGEGWKDRLRYKRSTKEVVTENWNVSGESQTSTQATCNALSGETPETPSYQHLEKETERGKRKEERGRGRGNSPENSPEFSGEKIPSPSSAPSHKEIFQKLVDTYPKGFGKMPDSRATAQLRDLSIELAAAWVSVTQIEDAFKEAAIHNKHSIPYVRKILLNWTGVEAVEKRARSP